MENKKRKLVTIAEDELLDQFLAALLDLPPDECAEHLAYLANKSGTTTAAIKRARLNIPVSDTKWIHIAYKFNLADTLENTQFERVATPVYYLPPSVLEVMSEAAWVLQDVYREGLEQRWEEARLRFMDPYLARIIGLFQGRIIDKPEAEYAHGGEVEHKIIMIGGILFFIAEFKFELSLEDNIAQLFLEILSAVKVNESAQFGGLRIYGLLTDLISFRFYSYNPLTQIFAYDETLIVNNTRDLSTIDMIQVSNKIFSVLLTAYIDGLEAILNKSLTRKTAGNVWSPGSAPLQQMQGRNAPKLASPQSHSRKGRTTENWEAAFHLAQQCRSKFEEPIETVDDIQRNSTVALDLLAQSVRSIPRLANLTAPHDPSSFEETKTLVRGIVSKKYGDILHKNHA